MTDVRVYIWDVELGDAILIEAPEGNIVLDLGQYQDGASPIQQMKEQGVTAVDYLIISHPDRDHFRDIIQFYDEYDPSGFGHPADALPRVKHKKQCLYTDNELYQQISDKYITLLENRYREPIQFPLEIGDLVVHERSLSADELGMTPVRQLDRKTNPNLDNLSLLNVIEYDGFKMVTMGDLWDNAIEQLLESKECTRLLRGTDMLVAPNHGRENSYTPELFDVISPDIVAISDVAGTDTTASNQYRDQAAGKVVERRSGDATPRRVVTNRNDGVLHFGIERGGNYTARID